MIVKRVPLVEEPISGPDTVARYDQYSNRFMMPEYRYFVRKILSTGKKSGRVLDIGTGNGRLAIELAIAKQTHFDIIGLDLSENMLQKAVENSSDAGISDNIQWIMATASRMPFPDNSFDLVISYASLHHWRDPVEVFNEVWRVTRPGGTILIRDNRRVYGNPFWGVCIWLLSRLMSREQRKLWPKSILASYTIPEIKDLLKRSHMKNYTAGTDFVKFDISIEVMRKPDV